MNDMSATSSTVESSAQAHDLILSTLSELEHSQDSIEDVYETLKDIIGTTCPPMDFITCWKNSLADESYPEDRMPYLYLANHMILHREHIFDKDMYLPLFASVLPSAIALVCTHPEQRPKVAQLLRLWEDHEVFSPERMAEFWDMTGLPLVSSRGIEDEVEMRPPPASSRTLLWPHDDTDDRNDPAHEDEDRPFHDTSKDKTPFLNGFLQNLMRIDRNQLILSTIESKLSSYALKSLNQLEQSALSPQDVLDYLAEIQAATNDDDYSLVKFKTSIQEALCLLEGMNQTYYRGQTLERELGAQTQRVLAQLTADQLETELSIERVCDAMDIQLSDVQEHQEQYPLEWTTYRHIRTHQEKRKADAILKKTREIEAKQALIFASEERARKEQQEVHKAKATEMVQQAKRRTSAGSGSTPSSSSSKAKEETDKVDPTHGMIWHPVLKELVRVPSSLQDSEDWRDH